MRLTTNTKGLTIDDPIVYDPTNKNPLQCHPFYVMPITDLEGVGHWLGENFQGYSVAVAVNPHYLCDLNNRLTPDPSIPNEFMRCRLVKKNTLKFEIPLQDYTLLKDPNSLSFSPSGTNYRPNVMKALYTLNKEYQKAIKSNNGRDPLVTLFLKFPDNSKISAKHVNDQSTPDIEANLETVVSVPCNGNDFNPPTAPAPHFDNSTYYSFYFVADLTVDASNTSMVSRPVPTVSDVAAAFSTIDVVDDDKPKPPTSSEGVAKKPEYEAGRKAMFKAHLGRNKNKALSIISRSVAWGKAKRNKLIASKRRASPKSNSKKAPPSQEANKGSPSFNEIRKAQFTKNEGSKKKESPMIIAEARREADRNVRAAIRRGYAEKLPPATAAEPVIPGSLFNPLWSPPAGNPPVARAESSNESSGTTDANQDDGETQPRRTSSGKKDEKK